MITFLAILVLIILVAGGACMINALLNGCPFAWFWFLTGGLEGLGSLMGLVLQVIADGFSE